MLAMKRQQTPFILFYNATFLLAWCLQIITTEGFIVQKTSFCNNAQHKKILFQSAPITTSLCLFGRNKKDEKEKAEVQPEIEKEDSTINIRAIESSTENSLEIPENELYVAEALEERDGIEAVTIKKLEVVEEEDTAIRRTRELRAQAERMRLEAEKMDAELTLEKISKLEREMTSARAKDKVDTLDGLKKEMEALQAKLRGDTPKPITNDLKPIAATLSSSNSDESSGNNMKATAKITKQKQAIELFSQNNFDIWLDSFKQAPAFIKVILANSVELDCDTVGGINATALALRFEKYQRVDDSYSSLPKPVFTTEQINHAKKNIKNSWFWATHNLLLDDNVAKSAENNETALAIMKLEYEYYIDSTSEESVQAPTEDWLEVIVENVSLTDAAVIKLYPKCLYNEDTAIVPKIESVQQLVAEVLPRVSFTPTGPPEAVLGGYIIRGSLDSASNGDKLIETIDHELEKIPSLNDEMTVLYTKDFSGKPFEEIASNPDDFDSDALLTQFYESMEDFEKPILFVTSKDICRKRQRLLLSLTSAFGIASSWYLSLYPFFLNPKILDRVNQQLDLASAGLDYDLAWLTDLSLPLFFSFILIQLFHEFSHKIVSEIYKFKITVPTFAPSIITGMISTVTTFKEPPKNKEAMFDFSLAGPITGILASVAALVLGSQLTAYSDASTVELFPVLPVEILRSSTLGGAIIDSILGNGALNIPTAALGTEAVAGMTVPLHPLAVAGFSGLIVNALSLLPVGTTDGGRIAMTLFGRDGKGIIGSIILSALLFTGIATGSDSFLFYFSFILAFQTGNEIPARNEVDDISAARVVLAILAFVAATLVLVPYQ